MVCKRACHESHSSLLLEEEVVHQSGGEFVRLCGVSVCVLASFLTGIDPSSHVKLVCDVLVSDSGCEIIKPQIFPSPESATPVCFWSVRQMNLERFEGALVKSGICNQKNIAKKVLYHRH